MSEINSQGHSTMNGLFLLEAKIQESLKNIIKKCQDLKEEQEVDQLCSTSDTQRFAILNKQLEKINNKLCK